MPLRPTRYHQDAATFPSHESPIRSERARFKRSRTIANALIAIESIFAVTTPVLFGLALPAAHARNLLLPLTWLTSWFVLETSRLASAQIGIKTALEIHKGILGRITRRLVGVTDRGRELSDDRIRQATDPLPTKIEGSDMNTKRSLFAESSQLGLATVVPFFLPGVNLGAAFALVASLLIPMYSSVALGLVMGRKERKLFNAENDAHEKQLARTRDLMKTQAGVVVVDLAEDDVSTAFIDAAKDRIDARRKLKAWRHQSWRIRMAMLGVGEALPLLLTATGALQPSFGALLATTALGAALMAPVRSIPKLYADLQQEREAESRVERVDRVAALRSVERGVSLGKDSIDAIHFHNVSFQALSGVTYTFPVSGRLVVVVGPSGAGKSTFLKVLTGIGKPESGRVVVSGNRLPASNEQTLLRSACGYVDQDATLLGLTVREAMRFGRPLTTDDEIIRALREVDPNWVAKDRLDTKAGLEMLLDKTIDQPSGGQRQRLALARALLGDPPILVLDEPTTQLDPRTRGAVWECLDRQREDRLVVVVSHEIAPARVRDAEVLLIEGGTIVECSPPLAPPGPRQQAMLDETLRQLLGAPGDQAEGAKGGPGKLSLDPR